jgi:hypothetical protein
LGRYRHIYKSTHTRLYSTVPFSSLQFPKGYFRSLLVLSFLYNSLQFPSIPFSFLQFPSVPCSSLQFIFLRFPLVPFNSQQFFFQFSKISYSSLQFRSVPHSSLQPLTVPFSSLQFSPVPFISLQFPSVFPTTLFSSLNSFPPPQKKEMTYNTVQFTVPIVFVSSLYSSLQSLQFSLVPESSVRVIKCGALQVPTLSCSYVQLKL